MGVFSYQTAERPLDEECAAMFFGRLSSIAHDNIMDALDNDTMLFVALLDIFRHKERHWFYDGLVGEVRNNQGLCFLKYFAWKQGGKSPKLRCNLKYSHSLFCLWEPGT